MGTLANQVWDGKSCENEVHHTRPQEMIQKNGPFDKVLEIK